MEVVDTVGSGDAFLAGFLSKILENVSPADTLDYASGLGAFIATQRGACPSYDIMDIENLITEKKTNCLVSLKSNKNSDL